MKIELISSQKLKAVAAKDLDVLVNKISGILKLPEKTISFLLCDDREIKKFNKKFFNRNVVTDVIAFALEDDTYFGEIIISVERALKVCAKYGNNWQDEFATYVIHGILHILGYDDTTAAKKKIMFKKQDEILLSLRGTK